MNWVKNIEGVIKNGKWIRNVISIGQWRYSKLVSIDDELMIFIISDETGEAILTRVENIMLIDNELIIFYDEEDGEILDNADYDEYCNVISPDEWEALFSPEYNENLEELNIISKKENYYIEKMDNINDYVQNDSDKEITDEICEHFNI